MTLYKDGHCPECGMDDAKPVVCVRHRNGWCALKGKLDPYARRDKTVCGYVVVLRWGSERRVPDCAECIAELHRHAPVDEGTHEAS